MVLSAAVVMLVAGQTFLKARLSGAVFIFYWVACFLCTVVAMVVALLDVRALQRETREKQKELLKDTIKEIESNAQTRPRRPGD